MFVILFFGVLEIWVFDFELWVGVNLESFLILREKRYFFVGWCVCIGSMGLIDWRNEGN